MPWRKEPLLPLKSVGADVPASVAVFLVALPLCLGIALASGAPLVSGLVSGILGGLVVGLLSKSHTSVSGPAAGLTAVVLAAVAELGAFEPFLVAVLLAGLIQVALGIGRTGFVANFFPSAVIHGLLAAIGLILVLKQIPHAVGYDRDAEGEFRFFQLDGENTFSELFHLFGRIEPAAVVVSASCLFLMLAWDRLGLRRLRVPAALGAVALGTLLNEGLAWLQPARALGGDHLVTLPTDGTWLWLFRQLPRPAWGAIGRPEVWLIGVEIALVASLETLLNIEAMDKIDPQRRTTPPNRELMAQGVGNILSGLLGGLPVTSVVVRGTVNIESGARSKLSAVLHGGLLLVCALLLPGLLNRIPLAALAAILLLTGWRLAHPRHWTAMYRKGWSQLLPFALTVAAVLFTDLLIGVGIGLAAGVVFVLHGHLDSAFRFSTEHYVSGELIRLKLGPQTTFLNRASIVRTLAQLPPRSDVLIDATGAEYVDADVLELIRDFQRIQAPARRIRVSLAGFRERYAFADNVQYVNVLTREAQHLLAPDDVLFLLREGNQRFAEGRRLERDLLHQMSLTADSQHPMAAVLGCIDSRTTSELIFDLGLGDVFNARVAGNVVNHDVLGSLEYATQVAGAKLIVVLGHTGCGAVRAACAGGADGNLGELLGKIHPAVRDVVESRDGDDAPPHLQNEFVDEVARRNVERMLAEIRRQSPVIERLVTIGKVGMVGAIYDIRSGVVEFFQESWRAPADETSANDG